MNASKALLPLALVLALPLGLAGCGNKGPLVLPSEPAGEVTTPEEGVPVEVETPQTYPDETPAEIDEALPDPTGDLDPVDPPPAEPEADGGNG